MLGPVRPGAGLAACMHIVAFVVCMWSQIFWRPCGQFVVALGPGSCMHLQCGALASCGVCTQGRFLTPVTWICGPSHASQGECWRCAKTSSGGCKGARGLGTYSWYCSICSSGRLQLTALL
eukprot:366578-Amphidinium_carterae.1